MGVINLVNSDKGGTGKSLFCSLLYEYCQAKNIDIYLVDAVVSNPDVGKKYKPRDREYDREKNPPSFDLIFDKALDRSVLVNLPANISPSWNKWFDKGQIFLKAIEYNVRLVNWYVIDNSFISVGLLKQFIKRYEDKLLHVLVKNQKICQDWEHLKDDVELFELIRSYKIKSIEIPHLDFESANKIDRYNLTFGEAIYSDRLSIASRSRVKSFVEDATTAIDTVSELL